VPTWTQAKTTGNWYSATAHYWDTGSGSGGITNGPLAPMTEHLTAAETISGQVSAVMAPMRLALTAHETGVNVTGTLSLGMAPMRLALAGPSAPYGANYLEDWHHRIWRRRRLLGRMGL
jgi:hypothetical protein